jgi:YidC/Oxa1 family membrane protein insertase
VSKRNRTLLLVVVLLLLAISLSGCGGSATPQNLNAPPSQANIWQSFVNLVAKALILLNNAIYNLGIPYSWGWAIIVFTILIKLVTLPLTVKQLKSAKATQELQPKIAELQQKYGKDRQKISEEQMKLYKEHGVSPMGGCLPLLIQMPILFALYQSLYVLADAQTVYPEWSMSKLQGAAFYWIPNLTLPSLAPVTAYGVNFQGQAWVMGSVQTQQWWLLFAYLSLPVLMLVSQLFLQKMAAPVKAAKKPGGQPDQTQMMGQMMMIMPIFFGYITLGLPAGLTLYWAVSNVLSVVQQYFISGWGGLVDWAPFLKQGPKPTTSPVPQSEPSPALAEDLVVSGDGSMDAQKIKRRRRRK